MTDRSELGRFLRQRRESLQPEDVGMTRGPRRRTQGLRREEVAALSHMSTDYYTRLERGAGPQPSADMIASIAQGLHLSFDERDYVFRLCGYSPPARGPASDHIAPGLLRVLDRLEDTPAEIVTELGETLRQTTMGRALMGDASRFSGPERSTGYRWFTDSSARECYPDDERDQLSRLYASELRKLVALRGPDSRAARLARALLAASDEFRTLWGERRIGVQVPEVKRFRHPVVGLLELQCQVLLDGGQSHRLLVYTAVPGTESYERLQLLSVLGSETMR
ncbi:helix-turn-helix transcriptional regulator [Microbacterium sp. E-13]|uniref:helix-turn-helix transcriptional regulator n=1 Tax=Microbacterium sp. E-13 TaxID=3404048 RepID=UPI003CEFA8BF